MLGAAVTQFSRLAGVFQMSDRLAANPAPVGAPHEVRHHTNLLVPPRLLSTSPLNEELCTLRKSTCKFSLGVKGELGLLDRGPYENAPLAGKTEISRTDPLPACT